VSFLEGRLLSGQSEQFEKRRFAGKKQALQKSHFWTFNLVNGYVWEGSLSFTPFFIGDCRSATTSPLATRLLISDAFRDEIAEFR